MASAALRQIIGGGAPINKSRRRRPQIIDGGAARPAHGSNQDKLSAYKPVWYENLSGLIIRPDNSKHRYRYSGWFCDWFSRPMTSHSNCQG